MYGMQWKSEYLPKKRFLGCGGAGFVLFAEWRYHTRYLFYMYALIRTGLVSSTIFNVLESSTLCLGTIDDFYNAKLHQRLATLSLVPSAWLTAWILSLLGLFQIYLWIFWEINKWISWKKPRIVWCISVSYFSSVSILWKNVKVGWLGSDINSINLHL